MEWTKIFALEMMQSIEDFLKENQPIVAAYSTALLYDDVTGIAVKIMIHMAVRINKRVKYGDCI